MKFSDIKPFTHGGSYAVDYPIKNIERTISNFIKEYKLVLQPDFQRPHVWDDEKRSQYVEYLLREGHSSRDIYFNCPKWSRGHIKDFVLVDGLQRITAVRMFFDNQIKAFGFYFNQFEDDLYIGNSLRFHVNELETRAEVLQWYLDLNEGGVVHTTEELDRVRELLEEEKGGWLRRHALGYPTDRKDK